MDELGHTLHALALHDDQVVDAVVESGVLRRDTRLDAHADALVRLAALVCLDAPATSFQSAVNQALAAGASPEELGAVLAGLAPLVGGPRLVSGASALAGALGYDLDASLEQLDAPGRDGP